MPQELSVNVMLQFALYWANDVRLAVTAVSADTGKCLSMTSALTPSYQCRARLPVLGLKGYSTCFVCVPTAGGIASSPLLGGMAQQVAASGSALLMSGRLLQIALVF